MNYCPHCGAQVVPEDRFCRACGQPQAIKGYCDTCQGAWYDQDMKCRTCGADDYTPLQAPRTRQRRQDKKNKPVSHAIAWWIAFTPLVGLLVANFLALATGAPLDAALWVILPISIALCYWDSYRHGLFFLSNGLAGALVPVYLYRRARFYKQKLTYFIVWCVCFAILIFVPSHYILDNPTLNLGLGSSETIRQVKRGYLDGWPMASLGEALDAYLQDESWTSFRATDGNRYVQVQGSVANDRGGRDRLLIQFPLSAADGSRFDIGAGQLNGQAMTQLEVMMHLTRALTTYAELSPP